MPSKKADLRAAAWRVLLAGRRKPLEVVAVSAVIGAGGTLRFADERGRLLKAFTSAVWATVELVDDPVNAAILEGLVSVDDLDQVRDLAEAGPTP
jgi:hypothetical protein